MTRSLPRHFATSACLGALAASLMASASFAEPVERPSYPQDEAVPRSLTPEERRWLEHNPLVAPDRGVTPAPNSDGLRATAEYEPIHGICLAWNGPTSWRNILREMAVHITTTGEAYVYIACDTVSIANSVMSSLASAGADMSRVRTMVRPTDTIWIRDYGPRYAYLGDVRIGIDHTYNRPRFNDNAYNSWFVQQLDHGYFELPLIHGGGNYHLNSSFRGFATELIGDENPGLSDPEIVDIWFDYQGVDTQLTPAYPSFIDSTQHIDMWLQVVGPQAAVISNWPFNAGSIQAQVADGLADQLTGEGWTVTRVPARSVNGTHYTYTNVVLCNDIVLVPTYTNGSVSFLNQQALDAWADAMPGKTIIPINCQNIVTASGVMHCITMHIPAHLGGENPTAYLDTLRGGQTLNPGDSVAIRWLTDAPTPDPVPLTVSIDLSTNGGQSFQTSIATGLADTGEYIWTVPDIGTTQARIRITASDPQGRTGSNASPANITITGTPQCPGDVNGDGTVDLNDLNLVLTNFGQQTSEGDADGNGIVDLDDLNIVLSNFGC